MTHDSDMTDDNHFDFGFNFKIKLIFTCDFKIEIVKHVVQPLTKKHWHLTRECIDLST
jgi:hypothetical protein